MADAGKMSMAKLNSENYFTWKYRMQMLLMKEKIWAVVNENAPEINEDRTNVAIVESWISRDEQARGWIGLSIDDSQLCHIRYANTAKAMWEALRNHHERDTLSNKVHLIRRICSMRMTENGNMEEHLACVMDLFQKLRDLGEEHTVSWTVGIMLSSLPNSYDPLVTALETRAEADLTVSLVQSKLIAEYYRQQEGNKENGSILKVTNGNGIVCFFCKKNGHFKNECEKFKSWKANKDKFNKANMVEQSEELLFMVSSGGHEGWVIDSGATCHIASNKTLFDTIDNTSGSNLNVANGAKVRVLGKGTCTVQLVNAHGVERMAKITDVYYAPDIGGNLMSVRRLLEKGFTVNFIRGSCEILKK